MFSNTNSNFFFENNGLLHLSFRKNKIMGTTWGMLACNGLTVSVRNGKFLFQRSETLLISDINNFEQLSYLVK